MSNKHYHEQSTMSTTTASPLSFLSVLCTLLLLFFSFLLVGKKKNSNSNGGKLLPPPPGPLGVPVLGHLLWIRNSILDISPILRRLRVDYGPVVNFKIKNLSSVFVVDRRLAHRALVQKGTVFSDRPPIRGANVVYSSKGFNVSSSNGALWRLLRRNLASEVLHPSRLNAFSGGRRRELGGLIEDLREQAEASEGVVVLVRSFQRALFRLFFFMCFGELVEDRRVVDDLESVQHQLLSMVWKLAIFDILPIAKLFLRRRWRRLLEVRRRQEEIMVPLISARRNAKQKQQQQQQQHSTVFYVDSLLNLELPVEDGRKLTDVEIVSLCSEFFGAGIDTTITSLEWIMANLVKHQHIQQSLVEEINSVAPSEEEINEDDLQKMPYLKATILEGLRRHPPAQFLLPHVVSEDTSLHGYSIIKGSLVNFASAEIGWDGEVWEEPFEFRPERFLGGGSEGAVDITGSREIKMMPFGAGRRMCPGFGLALLHLEYFVASLVREFEWKTVDGEEVDLSEKMELSVVMKNSLRARIIPREKAGHRRLP